MKESKLIRVLLVEDEPDLAEPFGKQLELIGHFKVDWAKDGNEALKKLSQHRYSVMLLDLIMPNVDGVEVLQQMQSRPKVYPPIPVVIFTNYSSPEAKALVDRYDFVKKFVLKTDVLPKDLVGMINNLAKNGDGHGVGKS